MRTLKSLTQSLDSVTNHQNDDQKTQELDDSRLQARDTRLANDTHSKLNPVHHKEVVAPASVESIQQAVKFAETNHLPVAISGGRHAMGGQQFVSEGLLLDMRQFRRILDFDANKGLVKVESGIMWKELVESLNQMQHRPERWSIVQKPTGADNISIGGCIASNVHGRGLRYKPFIQDVEALELLTAGGDVIKVDRHNNRDLFPLVIGGYGLFGIVTSVTLRLRQRQVMRRVVTETTVDRLMNEFQSRMDLGHEYGDFQFAIDNDSPDFLRRGILATYQPASIAPVNSDGTRRTGSGQQEPDESDKQEPDELKQHKLTVAQWTQLLEFAHTDKSRAYERYAEHYLNTDGQLYWSDTMQLSTYVDDYHHHLSNKLQAPHATEVITELYVPRHHLASFMGDAAELFRKRKTSIVYGTIRLIEQDDESFLAWAKESYACIIFNLHTEHSNAGKEASATTFRDLIDLAQKYGGSFYLTYHRHARRDQIESTYPQFEEFLKLKRFYDPHERLSSEWYRHHKRMFQEADSITTRQVR